MLSSSSLSGSKEGDFVLNVQVPVNTTATVHVPAKKAEEITEGGGPALQAEGVEFRGVENGAAVFDIGSGEYSFTSRWGV